MKHLYLILFLILFSLHGIAQGEYNNWVFGDSIWLDFTNGSPVVGNKPSVGHSNAASSISDKNGNLLFWMDTFAGNHPAYQGGRVWNANGVLMQNGDSLFGKTVHQDYTIVPFPCNDSLYYIFTKGEYQYKKILYYSVVNMNLNNGLGAVIQKNIFVDSNLTAAFAVTRHGNNTDFWISYQQFDTNVHITRQISIAGIGTQVISTIGTNAFWSNGYLKFSGNSSYLVNCFRILPVTDVYHFNNHTGILSNAFQLNTPAGIPPTTWSSFTSQFSSDNNKLYVGSSSSGMLSQYDFSSGIPFVIANSGLIISTGTGTISDMALGPDDKIYASKGTSTWMGVINQPNALGTSCNYVPNAINATRSTWGGLPTIIPNLFVHRDVLTDSLLCQYDTINLYLSDTNYIDSLVWSFGDPASGVANTSTDVIPLHVYNTYGTYPIEVIIYSGCVNDTIYDTIRINPTPIANLGPDTILCEGDSMQLLFNDTSFNYLWSTGDSSMSIQILNSDTFSIAISSICGVDYDTIVIDSLIPALVHLPNDTLLCTGDSLLLDATIQSGTYSWSNGILDSSQWVTIADTFWVTATNFCGTSSDTMVTTFTHPPLFDFGNDTSLCVGDTLTLNAYDTLSSYL